MSSSAGPSWAADPEAGLLPPLRVEPSMLNIGVEMQILGQWESWLGSYLARTKSPDDPSLSSITREGFPRAVWR